MLNIQEMIELLNSLGGYVSASIDNEATEYQEELMDRSIKMVERLEKIIDWKGAPIKRF